MRLFGRSRPKEPMRSETLQKKGVKKLWGGQINNEQYEEPAQQAMFHNLHPHQQVTGVNSSVSTYMGTLHGTTGENLWLLNFSSLPGQQKRLLTLLGASVTMTNYAADSFPDAIYISINEVTPSMDQNGNPSHYIGMLAPIGPAVPVQNPGNVIGYNIVYGLIGPQVPIDVSGIASLTFDVSINGIATPITYPLSSPVSIQMQVTHVMF